MRRTPSRAALLLGTALVAALAGCEAPKHTCGTYPEGGGPALVQTRDAEFCELLRARFHRWLTTDDSITHESAEEVWIKSDTWDSEPTVAALVERIRKDVGPDIADQVAVAAQWVRERSTRSYSDDCESEERCLVQRGAHGARVALENRDHILLSRGRDRFRANNPDLPTERAEKKVPPSKYRIDLDELED